ncbi:hypothetical protein GLOTRDRAFT_93334 [Gloeophyllum trabeum ATCC 11539]|uniref:DUF6533 domain-containing protein n=1 Tax=Gloeophyllum trabeum (strain ATCC 11539 / FP-39264 / Madison 617) TaxID=670483 RepID=S7RRY2_GLOTA|nr:uncharacterized protein GLOTRDRAFT_93334 [Gloeophyllum trabeum ATCC 11539]EPQ55774.1 hypothetical protein GLOTRDRAFT_93334 [Gloeophyllum trabeum ATCC 11539]
MEQAYYTAYFVTFSNALIVYGLFTDVSIGMCEGFNLERQIALVASQVMIGVLMVMRVYAMYNCNRSVVAGLLFAAVLVIAAAMVSYLQGRTTISTNVSGCLAFYLGNSEIRALRRFHNYLILMGTAITCYDYSITLGDEIRYIWRTPWSVGKTCFVLNRYFAIVCGVINLFDTFSDLSPRMCTDLERERQIAIVASQIFIEGEAPDSR